MKKRELLSMEPLYATDEMLKTANRDNAWTEEIRHEGGIGQGWTEKRVRRRYLRYFMARREERLLKVAIFTGDSLRAGNREPVYEVYIDRGEKKHLTYERAAGRWRTAKVSFLEYQGKTWTYCQEEWQGQEEREMVNRYFGTGKNLSIYKAVLDFQAELEGERLKKKHKSETDQIDGVMREVPEIPEGFEEWVEKNCFRETMFYEPKVRGPKIEQMYCTHCKEWMDKPGWPDGPEHKKEGACPACGAKVIYRSWNKQKNVREETNVGMLQRLKDGSGYMLREFYARRERNHEDGWGKCRVLLREVRRESLSATFLSKECFEYGEYNHTGIDRWCHEAKRGGYGYYEGHGIDSVVMYTMNLKEELAECAFGHMDLEKIFMGGSRKSVLPKNILQTLERYPFLEYILKSGLETLAGEIMGRSGHRPDERLFERTEKDIRKVLRLDGQQFWRMKRWDGGCSVLRALQLETKTGGKLSDDNIRYIMSEDVDMKKIENDMERTGLNLRQMLNYYKRQQETNGWSFEQASMFYRDYLDMAEDRGMDLRDDIVRRQARMNEYHDRYLEEKNREEAVKRDQEADLRFKRIKEDCERNAEHFGFEFGNYVFLVPGKASDITREGRLQHHCVGASDTYLARMNSRQSFIIFLRRKETPDSPYYTVEAKWDGKIVQWYAAYDRKPDEKKIGKVLERWSRKVRGREQKLKEEQKDVIMIRGAEGVSSLAADTGHMNAAFRIMHGA